MYNLKNCQLLTMCYNLQSTFFIWTESIEFISDREERNKLCCPRLCVHICIPSTNTFRTICSISISKPDESEPKCRFVFDEDARKALVN